MMTVKTEAFFGFFYTPASKFILDSFIPGFKSDILGLTGLLAFAGGFSLSISPTAFSAVVPFRQLLR